MPALGASVTPTPISNDNNPTCSNFGAWTELKVDPPGNGVFTDGVLSVTITNFTNNDPKGFDWTSNIGVDAVLVKAGSDKHNLYVYNPESTGDTGLGPQAGQGNRHQPHLVLLRHGVDADPVADSVAEPVGGRCRWNADASRRLESELGGNPTPTPEAEVPDTATSGFADQVPALVLSLVLVGSLATLFSIRMAGQRR